MNVIDLYFKHFPNAGWGKLHQFLNKWDTHQPFVRHPDPETQFKIDCAKSVRVELAKNWIIKNSEILNKKEEMKTVESKVEEFGEASEKGYQESDSQSFDWAAFNKELNRKAREYSGTFEGLEELDEKTKEELSQKEVVSDGPVEDELPGMYELVSESYYMLQELTEKKRQEEEIDTETFEMHKNAAIDAFTPEGMIMQVNMTNRAINDLKKRRPDFPIELISDGYHTFKELYEFRMLYNAALFNEWAKGYGVNHGSLNPFNVHKSWKHHDGEPCFGGGWFIVSAMLPTGLISNHYEGKYWSCFKVPETEKALFEFDGHTSNDVLNRLSAFLARK